MIRKPRTVLLKKPDSEPGWIILLTGGDADAVIAKIGSCDATTFAAQVPTEDLDQRSAWPIQVLAGAFSPGVPDADTLLPPSQHVLLNDHPIALADLVNGATISRRPSAEVIWTCLRLETSAALPVSRMQLLPQQCPPGAHVDDDYLRALAIPASAPVAFDLPGGEDAPRWRDVHLQHAIHLGHVGTTDPALSLELNGDLFNPSIAGRIARFLLPGSAGLGIIRTRFATPQTFLGGSDQRRLGVAVANISFGRRSTSLDHWSLRGGWHGVEPSWRWTDGAAHILVPAGARQLEVEIANTLRLYPIG